MSDYNLGTASGRIVVDGSPAELGFGVAKTAAGAFFDVVKARVNEIQNVGKRMAAVGAAGSGALAYSVKVAGSFEKQLSGVYAVAGATEEQMDAIRQKALDIGSATTFSASEGANALEELIKAGISVEDALNGGADAAVALAAAGGVGIAEAATIASNAMNQFSLSADEVGNVADILAGVANTSAADVSTLGQSLSQAGAVANLAGFSFKDTAIALGELANAGISGSDAGTSLKTMLNNLIPTTKNQVAEFERLDLLQYDLAKSNKVLQSQGLDPTAKSIDEVKDRLAKYVEESGYAKDGTFKNYQQVQKLLMANGALSNAFFKQNGEVKSLRGVQNQLSKATGDMTNEQKLASLELLFGADAMRASAILSKEGAKGYDEFAASVDKTKAADVAKVRLDNLAGAQEQLSGAIETAAITIGSVFLPIITKMVQALAFVVNAFNNLPGPVKTAIAVILAIASAGLLVTGTILALLPVILGMVANFLLLRVLKTCVGFIRIFIVSLRSGVGAMNAASLAATRTGAAITALGRRSVLAGKLLLFFGKTARAAFLIATGPIGIAIAAIAALVAIGVLLYKRWTPFREIVDKVAAVLKDKLQQALVAIRPVIAAVVDALKRFGSFVSATLLPVLQKVGAELLGKLIAGFQKIMASVRSQLLPALQQLGDKVQKDLIPALQKFAAFMGPILAAAGKVALIIGGVLLMAIMKVGKAFISYVLPILIKVAGFLGGVLIDTIVMLITGIIDVVTGIIKIFTGLIDFFAGIFTGDWQRVWEGVKSIFSGIVQLIIGIVKVYFAIGILKIFKLAFTGLLALVRLGWSGIVAIFKGAGRFLLAAVKAPFRLIIALFRAYINLWKAIFKGVWNFLKGLFSGGAGALRGIIQRVVQAIVNYFRGLGTGVKQLVQQLWNQATTLFRNGVTRAKDAVVDGIKKIISEFKALGGKIKDAVSGIAGDMVQLGKDIIAKMVEGVKAVAGNLASAAKDAVSGALKGALSKVTGGGNSSKSGGGPKPSSGGPAQESFANTWGIPSGDALAKQGTAAARTMLAAYANTVRTMPAAAMPYEDRRAPVSFATEARTAKDEKKRRTARSSGGGGGGSSVATVTGVLSIVDGVAYITGIAEDAVDRKSKTESRRSRMGG